MKPVKKQIIIRAEHTEHQRLTEAARNDRRSLSQYLIMAGLEKANRESGTQIASTLGCTVDDLLNKQDAS